jgi:hypothetical protein
VNVFRMLIRSFIHCFTYAADAVGSTPRMV